MEDSNTTTPGPSNAGTTEGSNTTKPEPPKPGAHESNQPQGKGANQIYTFLTEATKFTLIAVFFLYAIGFIIWHSYLASYGVSSVEFLQVEYLAAALCYLFFVSMVALPPAVILWTWGNKNTVLIGKYNSVTFGICMVWVFGLQRFQSLYFPGPLEMGFSLAGLICLSAAALHILILLMARKSWKDGKLHKILARPIYVPLYLLLGAIVPLFYKTGVDQQVLFFTFFLSASLGIAAINGNWKNAPNLVRILIVAVLCLILIAHVEEFGARQFGQIPKTVGGGLPEIALVKFSPSASDLVSSLNLTTNQTSFGQKAFVGPIQVLLRSDSEVIFLDQANTNDPERYFATSTNYDRTTNIVKNAENQVVSNIISTTIRIYMSPSPEKIRAKMVRSDLIDAIEYCR